MTSEEAFNVFPATQRAALIDVLHQIRKLLPTCTEDMSWGMPSFRIEGVLVLSLMGFSRHNSLFPGAGVHELLGKELEAFSTTKGTIHFDRDKAPPASFMKKLIAARIRVINASYPTRRGQFMEFYSHGVLKARGKYTNKEMQGPWEFYRRTGVIMRSGSFNRGAQVGAWTTFTAEGESHKVTHFT